MPYCNHQLQTYKSETMEINNISNDCVFAQLTDKFGDVPSDVIYDVCIKFNWKLEDCIDSLLRSSNEGKLKKPTNLENDVDFVVESEEIQNSLFGSKKSNELKQNFSKNNNIEHESKNIVLNNQQLTFAGAIKKTNRKVNNLLDIVDSPHSKEPVRTNTKTRFHDSLQLQQISNEILEGIKVMVIIRGPPGCGKSYLAREIIDATTCDEYHHHIFSTDDYFYDRRGQYNFNPNHLGEAHQSNKTRVNRYARDGWSPLIIDNTNTRCWEMNNYFEIAVRYGYVVHIVEPNTAWSGSAGKLAMKNSHNVPKESIERMMLNYELTTVNQMMESMGLKHTMPMPQYRQFPPLQFKEISSKPNLNNAQSNDLMQFVSKPQRQSKNIPKPNNLEMSSQVPDVVQYGSLEEAFQKVEKVDEWTSFDKESTQFWNNEFTQPPQLLQAKPKQQRNAKEAKTSTDNKDEINSNLFAILKENHEPVENKSSTDEETKEILMLHKHRKNCKNENNSFAQIREIYPSVPLEFLWDLFEKCEGDGDWTMDILLKEETRIGDYENLDSDMDRARNDFDCECDCDALYAPSPMEETSTINVPTYQRPPRSRDRNANNSEDHLATKRMIEESFQIGDEHYSDHTRKIRNIRHGVNSPAIIIESTVNDDQEGACGIDVDESESNDDEILEINLGMDLVCQLDSVFGVEAYQRETLTDMKTNVFMPKSLAQQLYALWLESMYNQLEEQRKKSIKEDAEFARQLQSQQSYPGLYKHVKPPSDLKEIMEMEYAWKAYKAEMDEWKLKTPQDLALQMTHDKLCNIFPNVDRDTLIEVLAAHNNKFKETVDVLKDTLSSNAEDTVLNEGRELFEEVRAEVEMTSNDLKLSPPASLLSWENKKLGPDEAKRSALKEFEDSRNLAMRHTQLKAECYNKAREAIQRGDTSVALYYSQVANLHKNKIDTYNHKAANCIMEVHQITQNNPDMLDLHYLHVNEAGECLDIFLDKHITKLRAKSQAYKYIFVITGRGLHSANGISTIKQKVKNRFRERHLTWSEVNPGLLKVKIFTNSRLTINL